MSLGLIPKDLTPSQASAWAALLERLAGLGSLLVAFSGGVDSALLLAAAKAALGQRVSAALCVGAFTPACEVQRARRIAADLGVRLLELDAQELQRADIVSNQSDRCYHCKALRLGLLADLAQELDLAAVAEGSQVDDAGDHRPGARAVRELGVHSPLAQAGLDKAMIRALSRALDLPTADVPAAACLASRVPWGRPLDGQTLGRIEAAEGGVRRVLGEALIRVRDHYPLARLELDQALLAEAVAQPTCARLVDAVTAAGYQTVCLDLAGYRQGGAQTGNHGVQHARTKEST